MSEDTVDFITVHGVLVRVKGTGVLIIGKSGTGKSECALELIRRGSQLVSDDVVIVTKKGSLLKGRAPQKTGNLMHIRDIGIMNIKELFGNSSVQEQSTIDLVIELKSRHNPPEEPPLRANDNKYTVFGAGLPYLSLRCDSGRNIPTLVETVARNIKRSVNLSSEGSPGTRNIAQATK